ncbi:MAG TPA: MFS transporter [Verrucomicrobiae bacterium]|nr:MFS transporter [Verrucomicrobiae bacterium]
MALGSDGRRAASLLARIERTQVSPWHIRALLVMGSATFFDAFDVLAIAYVLPSLIGIWKLAPRAIGVLISSSFVGQIVGALFFGWLAERIGRLRCAKITIALYSLMSLLCALSWNIPSLLLFRTIQGIGLGGEVPVAAAYINEISRAKGRGRFFLLYQLIFPIGLVGASLLGFWLVPLFGWRTMFLIGGLPAILVLVLFAANILPESPRWLVSKGRFEEAELIVGQMESAARSNGAVTSSTPEPLPIAPAPLRETSRLELFQGIYRFRTIIVWFIWITTYFVTYGVNTWLPTIFRTYYKYSVADALRYGVIINLAGLAGAFCCAMLVDHLGRRPWFILAYALGAAPLIAIWIRGASNPREVIVLVAISFTFISGNSMLVYLYTTEIYPTRLRSLGTGAASAWLRVASAAGPAIVGFALAGYGVSGVFLLFGMISLAGAAISFGTVETRERALEEISP